MYHAELENPGVSFCYLARDADGAVVGFCSFWRVLDELHINNLAVLPETGGAGVATRAADARAERRGATGRHRATLEVRRSNEPARLLYERFGFTVAGVRRGYYTKPVEERWCCGAKDLGRSSLILNRREPLCYVSADDDPKGGGP